MPKYTMTCDLLVPVVLEIEAVDENEAYDKLSAMAPRALLEIADTSNSSMGILDGSETLELAPE